LVWRKDDLESGAVDISLKEGSAQPMLILCANNGIKLNDIGFTSE
jgi:hypothetical protein